MFYICTKFCQSISYGLRVTDLNSGVDARVVANVDARTDGRMDGRTDGKPDPYIAPCLRQARQKAMTLKLAPAFNENEPSSSV